MSSLKMIQDNKIKGTNMQKKILVLALGTLFSVQAFAQQPVQLPQPNPADQVVIKAKTAADNTVPTQAANPYGSIQQQGATGINYDSQAGNINGRQINVPTSVSAQVANPNGVPNPAQAAAQMGVPNVPPTGLPQDSGQDQSFKNRGQIDPVEATINILNTPSSRIREANRDLYEKSRVMNETPVNPPKSINGVVTASIAPGAVSPVVRLFRNRTTAIIFTDLTGQPWPVVNYDGLSSEDFTVKRLDNPEGYVLSITPKGAFVNGNLAVILKGLPSPISVEFVSGQKVVDAKTEIRVQAKGPNTQFTSIGMPDGIDSSLLSVLQGVPPQGAKELRVSSPAVQAWVAKDGKMYVRTRYKVMSPAFENVTSSPDGTFAYKMVPVPVVLYKAAEGRFGEFNISGF